MQAFEFVFKNMESDRPTVGSNEGVVDGPGTTDGFTVLENRGDVNENGTMVEMDWYAMGQEEVQYQQNDSDELDKCPIDTLSCYWNSSNGKLMLHITELDGLG